MALSSLAYSGTPNKGTWDSFRFTYRQNTPWILYFKAENRYYFKQSNINEFLLRPAIEYLATKTLSLWAGYDFFQSYDDSNQHRQAVWGQVQINLPKNNWAEINSRLRTELRFSTLGHGNAYRARERIMLTFPLTRNNTVSPVLFDEVFFNFNHPEWVSNKSISQNRIFLGLEISFDKKTGLLFGYLNRTLYNTHQTLHEHLLSVLFQMNI